MSSPQTIGPILSTCRRPFAKLVMPCAQVRHADCPIWPIVPAKLVATIAQLGESRSPSWPRRLLKLGIFNRQRAQEPRIGPRTTHRLLSRPNDRGRGSCLDPMRPRQGGGSSDVSHFPPSLWFPWALGRNVSYHHQDYIQGQRHTRGRLVGADRDSGNIR
jgi:hypothetical protein